MESGSVSTVTADWEATVSNLRRYVDRRVDTAFADDVLGDILLRLVRYQQQLGDTDNPSAWIYRLASNAITDHYRRKAVEKRVIDHSGYQLPEPAAHAADEPSAKQELAACLGPLVQSLPVPYAEALLLTDIKGISQAAAAQQLGLSVSGMKSRVQRGRVKLKQALLRCCDVELDPGGRVRDYRLRSERCKC